MWFATVSWIRQFHDLIQQLKLFMELKVPTIGSHTLVLQWTRSCVDHTRYPAQLWGSLWATLNWGHSPVKFFWQLLLGTPASSPLLSFALLQSAKVISTKFMWVRVSFLNQNSLGIFHELKVAVDEMFGRGATNMGCALFSATTT